MNNEAHNISLNPAESHEDLNGAVSEQLEQIQGVVKFILKDGSRGDSFSVPHVYVVSSIGAVSSLLDRVFGDYRKLWGVSQDNTEKQSLISEIDLLLMQCSGILRLILECGEGGSWFSVSHEYIFFSLEAVSRLLDIAENLHGKLWLLNAEIGAEVETEAEEGLGNVH
jgi:hypothetical protein